MHSRGNSRSDLRVGEEGQVQVASAACLESEMNIRLTVGLVSGGRVGCRSPVDDGVGGEVGELRDGSQQTAGIYFLFSKVKRYLINVKNLLQPMKKTRCHSPFLFPR